MQVDRVDTLVGQGLGELDSALAGAGEDDGAAVGLDQADRGVDLLAEAADGQRVVGHRGDRAGVGVELVELGVAQVGADQLVDVTVERGAEQHPLRALGRHPDELVDRRVEAEVAQVVGLVEDGQLDVVEEAVAVLEQVLEPARRRDDDVGTLTELAGLLVVRRAAVHRDHLEARSTGPAAGWPWRPGWPARGSGRSSPRAGGRGGSCCRPAWPGPGCRRPGSCPSRSGRGPARRGRPSRRGSRPPGPGVGVDDALQAQGLDQLGREAGEHVVPGSVGSASGRTSRASVSGARWSRCGGDRERRCRRRR